ncbi:MAG: hypothetical protein RR547_04750 [Raoultibacter sp.]
MDMYRYVNANESDFPMNDTDEYGDIVEAGFACMDGQGRDGYCRRAEKRLNYALAGERLTPAMYRRLRDDYISAIGFGCHSLFHIRERYIDRWIELYDTAVWTYDELSYFLDQYTAIGAWDGRGGFSRDVRGILRRYGYNPEIALMTFLDYRKVKAERDIARFNSGQCSIKDVNFVEDYVGLLIKDWINNCRLEDSALCYNIVGMNEQPLPPDEMCRLLGY